MTLPTFADTTPTLAEKVAYLASPRSYPHAPKAVRTIETHMSWLFLTGTLAYKLKKPVRYPFLDFTTVGRRRHYCGLEVRLNRRLAGDIYRRVVALRRDALGALALDGEGETIDWLVEMEQLPDERMLHVALERGAVGRDAVLAVAHRLGQFYAAARPQRRDGRYYLAHLSLESAVSRRLLTRRDLGLPPERTARLLDRADGLLRQAFPLIRERIAAGLIVEGHGDLRPDHVALGPPPRVIDCLEFDRSMRLLDPYDEVNYLGLECELLGAPWIRPLILDVLEESIGRRPAPGLIATWGAFRALLRARICVAHLLDPSPPDPGHWQAKAGRYLDLAERECATAEGSAADGSSRRNAAAGSPRR